MRTPEEESLPGSERKSVAKRGTAFAVGTATLLSGLVLVTWCRALSEPKYQGHPLSYWVREANTTNIVAAAAAEKALNHIGTNALPFLLKWIAYDPHPSKAGRRIANFLIGIPHLTKIGTIKRWVYVDQEKVALAESVPAAFEVLGARGAPAIPALGRLLGATQEGGMAPRVITALENIGPSTVPVLIGVLTNGNPDARFWAAVDMTFMGTNARPAVPALILCLKDPAAASAAFHALGALKLEPELVVPALTSTALDPDPTVRLSSVIALGDFGPHARGALPTIRALLLDRDYRVRDGATNVLLAIAPEVLTNAPER